MKLDAKIVILLLIATITVTFSGCVEETGVTPEPEPLQPKPLHNDTTNISAVNLTLPLILLNASASHMSVIISR